MWYDKEKVFFKCKQCGMCCSRKSVVVLDSDDIRRASQYLEIKDADFRKKYLINDGTRDLIPVYDKSRCAFLMENNRCRIQDAKPKQCSSYPFWPHIITSKSKWYSEAVRCRGIDRGDEIKVKEKIPDMDIIQQIPEEMAQILATYVMCNQNKNVGANGRCYSQTCSFNKIPVAKERISKEGCVIFVEAEKYDRQEESGISGGKSEEDKGSVPTGSD